MSNDCFITYCSREKVATVGDLPAVERYLSERIRRVAALAQKDGASFRILSGQFGLLSSGDPIPYYDHLLAPEEVNGMAQKIAPALAPFERIHFHFDPKDYIAPYVETICRAAAAAGKILVMREIRLK